MSRRRGGRHQEVDPGQRRATIVVVGPCGQALARWDLDARAPLDLAVVDELARVQLAAQRMGLRVLLVEPSDALVALLRLVGLADALGAG